MLLRTCRICWFYVAELALCTQELGAAGQTKRPSSCMLIFREPAKGGTLADDLKDFQETYDDVFSRVKAIQALF